MNTAPGSATPFNLMRLQFEKDTKRMIRAYVGFDDTDNPDSDRGTGKLARWFERDLPEGCKVWGVVRQQLLIHEDIPYTSHNSSACVVVDMPDKRLLDVLDQLVAISGIEVERQQNRRLDVALSFSLVRLCGFFFLWNIFLQLYPQRI